MAERQLGARCGVVLNTLKFYGRATSALKIWNASLAQWNLRRLISSHAKPVVAL